MELLWIFGTGISVLILGSSAVFCLAHSCLPDAVPAAHAAVDKVQPQFMINESTGETI